MAGGIKAEHINPFLRSTKETFLSMVKVDARAGKIALKLDDKFYADVSGIIGLSGGAKGSVALSFPRITALKVVTAFGGVKVMSLDETVVDAIGELANIIAGAAKRDLARYRINISLPTVVVGTHHELGGPSDIRPMVVPFESPLGPFNLIVSFRSES